jgi:hypothetical protein
VGERRLPRLSALGLIVLTLTATFAMIDWVMSLEPHWYSTVYAAMVAFGSVLNAFAFAVLVRLLLTSREMTPEPPVSNDLGSLLLAILMSWAYLAFSQFLVIWSGNLSEEIPWYVRRLQHGWELVALAVALFHFVLPFVLLLSRNLKRRARALGLVAAVLFFTGILDVFWLVTPAFFQTGLSVHWLHVAASIGIGGLWLAAFAWTSRRWALRATADVAYAAPLQEEAHHG